MNMETKKIKEGWDENGKYIKGFYQGYGFKKGHKYAGLPKGWKMSIKGRENLSKSHKGNIPWSKGLTKETDKRIKKISEKLTGKKLTKEHIENCKRGLIGKHKSWNRGLTKETDIRIKKYSKIIFKIRDFGSCENYEKQRTKKFSKFGFKTLFLNNKDIMIDDWEKNCLNKINFFLQNEYLE